MKNDSTISQEEWEQLERYIMAEMSPEEHTAFSDRLAGDQELAEKLQQVRMLGLGIREAILQEKLTQFHQDVIPAGKFIGKDRGSNRYRWLAAAVAIAVIVIAGLLINRGDKGTQELFASFFEPDPGLPTVMGAPEDYEFSRGMVDYKTADYGAAIDRWRPLLSVNSTNDTLNYFTGVAFLAGDKADSAIHYLDRALTNNTSAFYSDASWYAALASIKKGDNQKARVYLNLSRHPKKDELLSQLK